MENTGKSIQTTLAKNSKYWALDPTTGLCTRLLGFAPDDWAQHTTTGLFTRLPGFAPDYWAFHPTTGLCTRLLGFVPDYWALHPTTGLRTRLLGLSPDDWALSEGPGTFREQHQTSRINTKMIEILKIVENGPIWLEMG